MMFQWQLNQLPQALALVASGRAGSPQQPIQLASSTDTLVHPQGDFYTPPQRMKAEEQTCLAPLPPQGLNTALLAQAHRLPALSQALQAPSPNGLPNLHGRTALQASSETLGQQLAMFLSLEALLAKDAVALADLHWLLNKGGLQASQAPQHLAKGEATHSTLYFLYSMSQTQRLPGFSGADVVKDALNILAKPTSLEQNNSPLDAKHHGLLHTLTQAGINNRYHASEEPNYRLWDEYDRTFSYNCAMAALMGRMAAKYPAELASQLNQLSSRAGVAYVRTLPQQLAPEAPETATTLLKRGNIHFNTDGTVITAELPASAMGIVRAHNTLERQQRGELTSLEASPLSVLYQTTLLYNASKKGYDVATDKRDTFDYCVSSLSIAKSLTDEQKKNLIRIMEETPQPDRLRRQLTEQLGQFRNVSIEDRLAILGNLYGENGGLIEAEKNLMERLLAVEDTYTSFPLQILSTKPNAQQVESSTLYLMGYTRSFEQVEAELLAALDAGHQVIISQTPVADDGQVLSSHEVKIDAYDREPSTQELRFYISDTQDFQKGHRLELAKELIPKINMISLPNSQARRLWTEQMGNPFVRLLPDEGDRQRYTVPTVRGDMEPSPDYNPALSKLRELYAVGKAPLLWEALMHPWLVGTQQ